MWQWNFSRIWIISSHTWTDAGVEGWVHCSRALFFYFLQSPLQPFYYTQSSTICQTWQMKLGPLDQPRRLHLPRWSNVPGFFACAVSSNRKCGMLQSKMRPPGMDYVRCLFKKTGHAGQKGTRRFDAYHRHCCNPHTGSVLQRGSWSAPRMSSTYKLSSSKNSDDCQLKVSKWADICSAALCYIYLPIRRLFLQVYCWPLFQRSLLHLILVYSGFRPSWTLSFESSPGISSVLMRTTYRHENKILYHFSQQQYKCFDGKYGNVLIENIYDISFLTRTTTTSWHS